MSKPKFWQGSILPELLEIVQLLHPIPTPILRIVATSTTPLSFRKQGRGTGRHIRLEKLGNFKLSNGHLKKSGSHFVDSSMLENIRFIFDSMLARMVALLQLWERAHVEQSTEQNDTYERLRVQ